MYTSPAPNSPTEEPMSDPTAQYGSLHLTREQAVLIASRLVATSLLIWAIADFTAIPRELLGIAYFMKITGSVLGTNLGLSTNSYSLRYYMLDLFTSVLRVAVWLMAAGSFYRCGPKISNFILPSQPTETAASPAQPNHP